MAILRFIHTADLQLGKSFGRFEHDVRSALAEARFDAIDTLGKLAAEKKADHVLVAGDVFDTEWPDDRVLVQAVSRMQRYSCRWWLLPGNHDSARNGGIWDRLRKIAANGISVLTEPEPRELEPSIWVLPAPLIHRHNLEDPTILFDAMETPGAALRVGLAHGSVRDFAAKGSSPNQIPPDRAQLSQLDYLALGDWHGTLQVDRRTWYSGTPETDRFRRDQPGQALVVELEPGSEPKVRPERIGRFQWLDRDWTVNDKEAFFGERDRLLAGIDPASTLLQLTLAGITSLSDRITILANLQGDLAHRLRFLDVRPDDLVGRPTEEDLISLEMEGMLGRAAAKLNDKIAAGGVEAIIARRALERLFVEYRREEA